MPNDRSMPFAPPKRQAASRRNTLLWIFDPLERNPSYLLKPMFGCQAAYLEGRLCLVAADRGDPWNGLLVCTSHDHHASLRQEMPALRPHPVLPKWLYLPQDDAAFETIAARVAELVLAGDPRVGVEPKPRATGRSNNRPRV
ncbi:MAG: hypothetical protein QHC78_16995 [Pigmentiphaga sp.]|uniref:hypothetical protein n=1 Tax=Pigmentiphaga sp. TaxID=1977564 RepID=UPI0029AC8F34|nr:hypothetical protein [Pigmentiphaga sp.]MDX3907389.1 hypothetical protein [Pigmentiphaga sp.]